MQRREGEPTNDAVQRLANLEALTDATLSELDIDALLGELLDRVKAVFDGDTAAVLMLDPNSQQLIARAARGLEEEVRQGVRIPLGIGFAGRIAASKAAVRVDHVDSTTVANPILWQKGIKVMVGVPLMAGDEVLGVLHVGRLDQRAFTEEDADLLQVAGERIASAIQVRQLAAERAATELLELSLLPGRLPTLPGLTFETRYVPAEDLNVGGDWYDIFTLPSGQLWIVIGDVAGHGLLAAVVMGRIRSALRAYTLLGLPVTHVLDLVDRKVRHFEMEAMATVLCAVSNPPYETVTIALAGHPPPVLAIPGRPAKFISVRPGPPIGSNFSGYRDATTIELPADSVMGFYTDGLVERRGESLDEGFDRLRAAFVAGPPSSVAANVMRELIGNSGWPTMLRLS